LANSQSDPEPSATRSTPPSLAARLASSSIGCALAVALALGAAHWYERPHFSGAPERSIWLEPDFLCSLASSVVALATAARARRSATRVGATAARSVLARTLIWACLTLLFFGAWLEHVFLFALLIAPTHAFAGLRLIGLWSAWRTEVVWQRRNQG
jgi:hypothetical protein